MNNAMLYDVAGIGNAIVDVVVQVEPAFLDQHALPLGAMVLVDAVRARQLLDAAGASGRQSSGGSAANTIAGLASLGARCAYIGKLRDDSMGAAFRQDLRQLGVAFATSALDHGAATANCLVLVTPDAQRTMATYLGASVELGPRDVEPAVVGAASITYLEGYLFDPPQAKAAFRRAVELSHGAGQRVALTLSDAFCVERHRADFMALVEMGVDILFANQAEITALLGSGDPDLIRQRLSPHCQLTVVTRSEHGSVIIGADAVHEIAPFRLGPVVDTTGAGDLYASGFLYGLTHGLELPDCGALASLCAAEVISHFGARPQTSLRALATEHGLGLGA